MPFGVVCGQECSPYNIHICYIDKIGFAKGSAYHQQRTQYKMISGSLKRYSRFTAKTGKAVKPQTV